MEMAKCPCPHGGITKAGDQILFKALAKCISLDGHISTEFPLPKFNYKKRSKKTEPLKRFKV